ncbi:hypothetical protein F2P56_004104 [Juglans regia]|uniref:Uncharacterized protein LOC108986953 n=2 Tax=Juglans regia TaxID=51240 RepID=A0A2I4E7D5_JUGRE|nr:uncharacterized protein LOC108986953 [Juglans regia]XP_035543575.1 uncharacterized protein LOC118347666 [Juglans regia]KAF5477467.1 hypothetical protein F2P56_004104 [Juglans regia]
MCGLIDLSCSGQRMSCCNGHVGASRSWAKLDRVLINNSFSARFQSAQYKYLNRKSSYHCPLVVYSDLLFTTYSPSPFRFLNMWCLHNDFLPFVKEVWSTPDQTTGLMKLAIRLKGTKVALRAWNKNIFGRVEGNIRALEERMEVLENQLQSEFSEEIEVDFLVTKIELELWEKREATRLGQIAKKNWLIEGDQNFTFFHSVINQRCQKGMIKKMVLSDGRILENAKAVHNGAENYCGTPSPRLGLDGD